MGEYLKQGSCLNHLPMATLFSMKNGIFSARRACGLCAVILLVCTTSSGYCQRFAGIGRVPSAKDRAQGDVFYQQAFAAFQGGDYPKTLSLIAQADQLKPDQSDGWNLRGMALLRLKEYDQAAQAFGRAVALDPALWAAQFNLAEASFQQKKYPQAQKGFERLLSHTDRFKSGNRWELVQYKIFLCGLLGNNPKGADQAMARLPKAGAATPARLYAEAALAYQGKQSAAAQKSLALAQKSFPAATNDLFADSLVQAGWQNAPISPAAPLPTLSPVPAGTDMPPGVVLATSIPGQSPPPYYTVDPKVEAAAAEPLPLPDAGTNPIVGKIIPIVQTHPVDAPLPTPKSAPAPVLAAHASPPPQDTPDVELEHRDLLMVE